MNYKSLKFGILDLCLSPLRFMPLCSERFLPNLPEIMMNKKSIQQILADPFATESRWMAANTLAGNTLPAKRRDQGPAAALSASIALACCTSAFAMFGFDWGREILEEIIGRDVQFSAEMNIAAALNLCTVLPATFGLYSGYLCKDRTNRTSRSLAVTATGLLSFVALFGVLPWYALATAGIGIVSSIAGNKLGQIVAEQTSGRSIVQRTFLPALVYLIPAGLLLFFHLDDGNFGFKEEVGVFLSLVFVACSLAARSCGAKNASAGCSAAFFASLPLVIVNTISIIGVLAVSVLDPSRCAEAVASMLIVLAGTTAAAALGGCYGALQVNRRSCNKRLAQT